MVLSHAIPAILSHEGDRSIYVMQESLRRRVPHLLEGLIIPPWIPSADPYVNIWIGKNTVTGLHYDDCNNFYAQTFGVKNFVLFPPSDTGDLSPFPIESSLYRFSSLPDDDVIRIHQAKEKQRSLSLVLQPGELLFLPAFWWHRVASLDTAVSVNFWWRPEIEQALDAINSDRCAYTMFLFDRLSRVEKSILINNNASFATASKIFLSAGHEFGSFFLSLAAIFRCSGLPAEKLSKDVVLGELAAWLEEEVESARHDKSGLDIAHAMTRRDLSISTDLAEAALASAQHAEQRGREGS